jgi:hypothetical protein
MARSKSEVCLKPGCGSEDRVRGGRCNSCRSDYAREYYRRKLALHASEGGPLVPRSKRGFCSPGYRIQKAALRNRKDEIRRDPKAYMAHSTGEVELNRRLPGADAPLEEKLKHPEWRLYYSKLKGL